MELFDTRQYDDAEGVSKSISARETPASSPMATSSGFFTDSTYSLDSSTLPVISEAGYFSSTASVTSSFKARHLAMLRESRGQVPPVHSRSFGYEPEEAAPADPIGVPGRPWPMRKRTASDVSSLSSLKRSRSVVATTSTDGEELNQQQEIPLAAESSQRQSDD